MPPYLGHDSAECTVVNRSGERLVEEWGLQGRHGHEESATDVVQSRNKRSCEQQHSGPALFQLRAERRETTVGHCVRRSCQRAEKAVCRVSCRHGLVQQVRSHLQARLESFHSHRVTDSTLQTQHATFDCRVAKAYWKLLAHTNSAHALSRATHLFRFCRALMP